MSFGLTCSPAARGCRWRLPAGRIALLALVVLALGATVGTAVSRADSAPAQWQPASADLVRTLRPCPTAPGDPTSAVCWSVTEDTSAWMAVPAGSSYPWGQCTYYAGLIRPDIWNDRAPPSVDALNDWDAWTWVVHAQAEGLRVDGHPAAGDVIVYARAAVGNDTGHVAIVDSVGGTDPVTGDVVVTVSEMNVHGLDDASLGQGDTSTLFLPQSELVAGMIQFIHQPGAGYTPAAWPGGSSSYSATAASRPGARNPSLGVSLFGDQIETVSESPAPVRATVTALPGGTVVQHLSFAANRSVTLRLRSGTHRVCVAQAAAGQWAAADSCVTGSWRGPIATTLHVGSVHRSGHRLSVTIVLGPERRLAGSPVIAQVRLTVDSVVRRGRRGTVTRHDVSWSTRRLHAGRQVLNLPESVPGTIRHATVSVSVAGATQGANRLRAARASVPFR